MSNSMNLDLPTVGSTLGPDWATKLNAALLVIAEHTHTTGDGVKVTPAGLNINDDLSMGGNDLTTVRTVRLSSQGGVVGEATDLGCVVNVNGDLYWVNNAGTPVQLTSGGAINIASVGTIGGDYGQPGVTASVTYSDTTKTFTFLQDSGEAAEMFVGDLNIANAASGSVPVTISASASTSAYEIILPVAAPTADSVLTFSGAGQGTFRTITGTSGEVTVSASSTTHQVSLPSTITKDIALTGNMSGRGILPVGSVIATFPNLTGAYACTATTAADANGFVQCAGQTLSDATSPMNGQVIPNINDDVFLRGNATAGSSGGSNASITLSSANLPSHSHTIDHGHSNTFGLTGTTTFAANGHVHDMAHAHQTTYQASTGAGSTYVRTSLSSSGGIWSTGETEWGRNGTYASGGNNTFLRILTSEQYFYTSGALNNGGSVISNTGSNSSSASVGFSGSVTSHSGSSGSVGSGTAFSVTPKYITARYIMRVR